MNRDPYLYPETDVLKNNYNIMNNYDLKDIEADFTNTRQAELYDNPIKGKFDLNHLKSIHKHIFQDLYPWAGEVRSTSIEKGISKFTTQENLENHQKAIFGKLHQENYLKWESPEQFADRSAYFLGEINKLHPFREGNGRAQREFFRELAKEAGHELDLSKISKSQMLVASFNYNEGNTHEMRVMVLQCILKKDNKLEVEDILQRSDRLKKILNAPVRPISMSRSRKIKNPDIINEYLNQAKEIIKNEGKWSGSIGDRTIASNMITSGYPKFKIENAINHNSLEITNSTPIQYAKQIVKEMAKSLSKILGNER